MLLLLSGKRSEGVDIGGDGAALPVRSMLLNTSTSSGRFWVSPPCPPDSVDCSVVCCSPNAASLVANVREKGLYPGPGAAEIGTSEPEFHLVARSKSESAVAVESDSS